MTHRYLFRPATAADLPLLKTWRRRPHMIEWWGPPDVEEPAEALADPHTNAWVVELDGRPFAYEQDYDPHAWDAHPFSYLPPGSRGIDQSIGEPDMLDQGHGSAFVRQHCDRLFADGAPAVGTDPHPENARAIRAYEKAGFAIASGPMDTLWGRAILMERWAAPELRSVRLFSYGTLQLPEVQQATYGRLLDGSADALPGFTLAPLAITDPEVMRISGAAVHTIARRTGNPADLIRGVVFSLRSAELAATDRYEVDAYARIAVRLASGTSAFVYVGPDIA